MRRSSVVIGIRCGEIGKRWSSDVADATLPLSPKWFSRGIAMTQGIGRAEKANKAHRSHLEVSNGGFHPSPLGLTQGEGSVTRAQE